MDRETTYELCELDILADYIRIFDNCFFLHLGDLSQKTHHKFTLIALFFHIKAQLDALVSQEVILTRTTFS